MLVSRSVILPAPTPSLFAHIRNRQVLLLQDFEGREFESTSKRKATMAFTTAGALSPKP